MTPEEKIRQMEKLQPYVKTLAARAAQKDFNALKRATRYPAYLFLPEKEITGMGKWTVVVVADTRGNVMKGQYTYLAFQTFHVTHSKNPINNGKGIWVCHPQIGLGVWCNEYPPHYFSRLRERLIEPRGIVQPDFLQLVRELFRLHHHSMNVINEGTAIKKGEDGLYDVVKDESLQRQPGYDNFASYHKEGISLGVCFNRRYYLHTTFVSNDLLKRGQVEMQKENLAEANNHDFRLRYDKEATFMEEKAVDGHVEFGLERKPKK